MIFCTGLHCVNIGGSRNNRRTNSEWELSYIELVWGGVWELPDACLKINTHRQFQFWFLVYGMWNIVVYAWNSHNDDVHRYIYPKDVPYAHGLLHTNSMAGRGRARVCRALEGTCGGGKAIKTHTYFERHNKCEGLLCDMHWRKETLHGIKISRVVKTKHVTSLKKQHHLFIAVG